MPVPAAKYVGRSTLSLTQPGNGKKVTVMKDSNPEFPEIWLDVLVVGPPEDTYGFASLFARAKCRKAKSVETADFVVFAGGPDVDPIYYGERPHASVYLDPKRDAEDIAIYMKCIKLGKPMIGVCRGAQFLHVMNGGKLYQDVDGHQGAHSMFDPVSRTYLENVSSVHHQMVRSNIKGGMMVLGESFKSTRRALDASNVEKGSQKDIEAFFYRDTCCLGVQGHPEYAGYGKFSAWFLQQIYKYVVENPDIINKDGFLQIKPDILAQRQEGWGGPVKAPGVITALSL